MDTSLQERKVRDGDCEVSYLRVTEEQLGETLRTFVLFFEVVQRD